MRWRASWADRCGASSHRMRRKWTPSPIRICTTGCSVASPSLALQRKRRNQKSGRFGLVNAGTATSSPSRIAPRAAIPNRNLCGTAPLRADLDQSCAKRARSTTAGPHAHFLSQATCGMSAPTCRHLSVLRRHAAWLRRTLVATHPPPTARFHVASVTRPN